MKTKADQVFEKLAFFGLVTGAIRGQKALTPYERKAMEWAYKHDVPTNTRWRNVGRGFLGELAGGIVGDAPRLVTNNPGLLALGAITGRVGGIAMATDKYSRKNIDKVVKAYTKEKVIPTGLAATAAAGLAGGTLLL